MKHSPEPWTTDGICVYDANHKLVATLSGFGHEAIATRRLIVAAPELLKALCDLEAQIDGAYGNVDLTATHAAISKATKKQT